MKFVEDYFDLETYKAEFRKQTMKNRVIRLREQDENILEYIEDYFDLDEFNRQTIRNRTILYRKKNQSALNLITLCIIIVSFVLAVLLYDVLNYTLEQWRTRRLASKAQNVRNVAATANPAPATSAAGTDKPSAPATSLPPTGAAGASSPLSPAPAKKRGVEPWQADAPASPVNPTFRALRETFGNNDIVAFITIAGTEINYPVVQAKDNEFYLSHDVEKKKNSAGSIFLDYENALYPLSSNTVVYGHNMKSGAMFHDIRYYEDQDFYNEHTIITMQTLYEDTKWEVFSFYETNVDFCYIQTHFENEDSFAGFVESIRQRAYYDTDVQVGPDDSVLTLSTCTNADDNMRKVLHAVRMEWNSIE